MKLRIKMMLGLWAIFLVLGACEDSFDGTVARNSSMEESSVKKDSMGFKLGGGLKRFSRETISFEEAIKEALKEFIKESGMKGSGTQEDPYQIRTPKHLKVLESAVYDRVRRNYKLMNDLDLQGLTNHNPIGNTLFEFEGTFDGNGKKIKNLKIKELMDDASDRAGLFGYIGKKGVVKDLKLENISVEGKNNVGGIAGNNYGLITRSHVINGRVSSLERAAGGLVGFNAGKIRRSSASGRIKGENYVGGLVGWNHKGSIERSHSSVKVKGRNFVGGLVGANFHKITNYYSSNNNMDKIIIVEMSDMDQNIRKSYATGNVSGKNVVGGLVGWNFKAAIKNSHARGDVKAIGAGNSWIGGLVGWNYGQIYDSYATGNIKGVSNIGGGLVGLNVGTIVNSNARGAVEGVKNMGGLVGWHGKLNFDFSKKGTGSELKGFFKGSRSHWLLGGYRGGSHDEESYIGNSRARGSVTGTKNVGQLVGYRVQGRDTTIKDSVGTGRKKIIKPIK